MYEGYETIAFSRDERILTVTLNRPEVRNATNATMHAELKRVFPEIGSDPDVDVVILTGAGESFSAGGDIAGMNASLDDHGRWNDSMAEARAIISGLIDLDRPVICRINGHAMGLGATLALFCDITVAVDTAKIADPHVKVGLVAGDGGALIWPILIGYARAKRYLLTGDPITGADAAAIGLISEAVPRDRLDARVQEIAHALAAGATQAIRGTKRATNLMLKQQFEAVMDAHLGLETMSHLTHDHREAVAAFSARRAPVFTGR